MSDTPPFNPYVGETFNPSTEVGIVQNTGNTENANGTITVGTVVDSHDATVDVAFLGQTALDTTGVTVTGITSGVDYTTQGSQDNSGTNLDGLGGHAITDTTEFNVSFSISTSSATYGSDGNVSQLSGTAYYIGTDGTHALVETIIVLPSGTTAASFAGHNGTIILDTVLDDNPFITGTTANALGTTFDTQGAPTPCYLRGTMIATPDGERAVETLAIGDLVATASGERRAIRWIGTRAYDGRFTANNPDLVPVVFEPGSIADNMPVRPLRVSGDHAMFVDGVLVPAVCLVNGTSIHRDAKLDTIEYFHVELDSHDVLVADGAHAESFVDCDSRNMFVNDREHATLYPEDASAHWTFCAPRLEDGVRVASIQARLARRAADLGMRVTVAA